MGETQGESCAGPGAGAQGPVRRPGVVALTLRTAEEGDSPDACGPLTPAVHPQARRGASVGMASPRACRLLPAG